MPLSVRVWGTGRKIRLAGMAGGNAGRRVFAVPGPVPLPVRPVAGIRRPLIRTSGHLQTGLLFASRAACRLFSALPGKTIAESCFPINSPVDPKTGEF